MESTKKVERMEYTIRDTNRNVKDIIQDLEKTTIDLEIATEDLRLTKIKYDALYEETPDLCRTIDRGGIILGCNRSYAEALGYSKQEIIAKSIFEHSADDSLDQLHQAFEKWKKTGRVANIQIWLKKKDGSTFPVIISAGSLFDENGKLIGSNTIIKNISEIQALKDIEQQKNEFAGMISHELRTPLYQISGYSELLKGEKLGPLNPEQKDAAKVIYEGSTKLDKLINDILVAQKLEMDLTKFDSKHVDVEKLLSSTYKNHLQMVKEKEIKFVNSFLSAEKLIIKSDVDRLAEVFTNLICNSVDFVQEKKGRIEIGAFQDQNKKVIFYVKDNGVGIPLKGQKNLFKKFYQVDTTLTRKRGGSGLGLAICKGIVEKLGGRIWVESKLHSGSTFYFSIPKDKQKASFEEYEKGYVERYTTKKKTQNEIAKITGKGN